MTEDGGESSELDRIVQNIVSVLESEDSKIYSEEVIAEFRDPANVGSVADADGVGIADGLCNDTMEITLKFDGDRIARCMFFTDGCGATVACGSKLTKIAIGKTVEEALEIEPEYLAGLLGGLPDDHKHCTSLAVIALKNALRNYVKRRKEKEGGEP
ncbi:MAG: iron-sulfur cluster assembly scaffold protein [Candidatus Thermoplasmatota archaeon]|nr:iron-sulfur cluster assembly scaffold protein [Candidatus Thermoplasmatota archaeon]